MLFSSRGSKKTLYLWDTKRSEREGDDVEEGRRHEMTRVKEERRPFMALP